MTNPTQLTVNIRLNTLINRIASEFTIDTLHKSPARFDLKKLLWFNEQYISLLSFEEFVERTRQFWEVFKLDISNPYNKMSLILDKNRINQLDQVGIESAVIWNYSPCGPEELRWKKSTQEESTQALRELTGIILTDSFWELNNPNQPLDSLYNMRLAYWEEAIKKYLVDNNRDYGAYLWPLRLALSGKAKSASSFEILAILPKEEVAARLNQFLGQ